MNIDFDIKHIPDELGGYHLTAYTEGDLSIEVLGSTFLVSTEILLVELAVALHIWVSRNHSNSTNFFYASMDFEDEPILAFKYDEEKRNFWIESVWSPGRVGPVPSFEVVGAVREFINRLSDELEERRGIKLRETLDKHYP